MAWVVQVPIFPTISRWEDAYTVKVVVVFSCYSCARRRVQGHGDHYCKIEVFGGGSYMHSHCVYKKKLNARHETFLVIRGLVLAEIPLLRVPRNWRMI